MQYSTSKGVRLNNRLVTVELVALQTNKIMFATFEHSFADKFAARNKQCHYDNPQFQVQRRVEHSLRFGPSTLNSRHRNMLATAFQGGLHSLEYAALYGS